MFSRISGVRIRRRTRSTLRATTSTASRVQGRGARCPIGTPPARVYAMCSLHQGGSSRATSSAMRVEVSLVDPLGAPQRKVEPVRDDREVIGEQVELGALLLGGVEDSGRR